MSQDEIKTPVAPVAPPVEAPKTILTGPDAHLASVVTRQPKDILHAQVKRPVNFDRYALPKGCEAMRKKYRFKWVGKTERQIARATEVEQWSICTRQNAPFIHSSVFGIHGAVEKGGLILAFMPEDAAKDRNARLRGIDKARRDKMKKLPKQDNFYEAKLSPEEQNNNNAGDHQQGRDF